MAKATKKAPAKKRAAPKKKGAAPKKAKTAKVAAAADSEYTKPTNSTDTPMVRAEDVERNWWIVDASGLRIGRLATVVATLLRGKHKPTFTPNADNGDFVIVINTDKIEMTGNKVDVKKYYRHSRFFGSLKEKSAAQYMKDDSTFVVKQAVEGMLPKSRLAFSQINKLKAFKGAEHPHAVQKPQAYAITRKG